MLRNITSGILYIRMSSVNSAYIKKQEPLVALLLLSFLLITHHIAQLYEQGADSRRIGGHYVWKWGFWVHGVSDFYGII